MTTPVRMLLAKLASSISRNSYSSLHSSDSNNIKTASTRITSITRTRAKAPPPPRPQINTQLLMIAILVCVAGGGVAAMSLPISAQSSSLAQQQNNISNSNSNSTDAIHTTRSANRTRLQKREYSSFKERFHVELNSTTLDWSNGCGGNWTGSDESQSTLMPHKRCAKHKKMLRKLQRKTIGELRQLRSDNKLRKNVISITAPDTASNQAIDTSQRDTWKNQLPSYSFLPQLNTTAHNLQLRRIHHDLQFYVASFSYLRHAQLHWDYVNLKTQSVLSAELLRFRTSARAVLCIVEEAINATNQLYVPSQKNHQRHRTTFAKIKTVPRLPMEKRLMKYRTPVVQLHKQAVLASHNLPAGEPHVPHELDTLFLKIQYMQYLKQMSQLLRQQRDRNCVVNTKVKTKLPINRNKARPRMRNLTNQFRF